MHSFRAHLEPTSDVVVVDSRDGPVLTLRYLAYSIHGTEGTNGVCRTPQPPAFQKSEYSHMGYVLVG